MRTLSQYQIRLHSNLPPADHNTASCHYLTKFVYEINVDMQWSHKSKQHHSCMHANLRLSSSAAVGIAALLRPSQHSITKVLALITADTSSDGALNLD